MKIGRNWVGLVAFVALAGCEDKPATNYNIAPSPHILTVTEDDFDKLVLKSDKPVLVDFYADWCGPCRALEPALNAVEHQYHGRLVVARLNVDENPKIATQYAVTSIPLLLLFNRGKVVGQQEGLPPDDGSGDLVQSMISAIEPQLRAIGALE